MGYLSSCTAAPPLILICRYEWVKELFVHQADYFSNRPTHQWAINYFFKGKGNCHICVLILKM